MSKVEKISIALSPELIDVIRKAVEAGGYASTSEVIREALRDWRLRQSLREAEVASLRQAWDDGIASGVARPLDMNKIKTAARRKLEASIDQ